MRFCNMAFNSSGPDGVYKRFYDVVWQNKRIVSTNWYQSGNDYIESSGVYDGYSKWVAKASGYDNINNNSIHISFMYELRNATSGTGIRYETPENMRVNITIIDLS